MDKSVFLFFSHNLTPVQITELKNKYKVTTIVELPKELQNNWSNVPTSVKTLNYFIKPFKNWLESQSKNGDYAMVHGDFGATFLLVQHCLQLNVIPIYATSKRIHKERVMENGTVQIEKEFKHVGYRKYEVLPT